MKVLGNLPIVKDQNVKYPFGAGIIDETDTNDGTPVIKDIYNDTLMNIYKLLSLAKITPTDTEDNENTQYQLIEALKLLPNSLNDIEQVLTLNSLTWSVPYDLDILPNKYVFFARVSSTYLSGQLYKFKGVGTTEYNFSSPTGFNANDEVIVIIDQGTVRAYSVTLLNRINETFTVFGTPLSYNSSSDMYYSEDGYILNDLPSSANLQNNIRVFASNSNLYVIDVWLLQGKVFCVVFDDAAITYKFYSFSLTDLTLPTEVVVTGGSIPAGSDNKPYFYTDGTNVYITNRGGSNNLDYVLEYFVFDGVLNTLSYVGIYELENTFIKTTNAVIKSGYIYTLINGQLNRYVLVGQTFDNIGYFNGNIGQIFVFNGDVYFTSGEVAKKWNL